MCVRCGPGLDEEICLLPVTAQTCSFFLDSPFMMILFAWTEEDAEGVVAALCERAAGHCTLGVMVDALLAVVVT